MGQECKTCQRPFTVFSWVPAVKERRKRTEICNACARLQHICQVCVLDLDTRLKVHERNAALNIRPLPASIINRDFYIQHAEAVVPQKVQEYSRNLIDNNPALLKAVQMEEQLAGVPSLLDVHQRLPQPTIEPLPAPLSTLFLAGISATHSEEVLRYVFRASHNLEIASL